MSDPIAEYQSDHDLLIRVDQKVTDLINRLDKRDKEFVTQAEFWPVKMLVYGCTSIMLVGMIGALVAFVLN